MIAAADCNPDQIKVYTGDLFKGSIVSRFTTKLRRRLLRRW
jgi:hypothetical protein